MKFRKIFSLIIAAALTAGLMSCGSKDSSSDDSWADSSSETDPVDFEHGSRMLSAAKMDSITNFPDEMTAGEAAGALVYLHHATEKATGRKRLESMRKFNDFFNIVLDNHGDNLRASIAKLRQHNGIDLQKIYEDYAGALAMGDEDGSAAVGAEAKPDTIKTFIDSASTVTTIVAADGAKITTVGE